MSFILDPPALVLLGALVYVISKRYHVRRVWQYVFGIAIVGIFLVVSILVTGVALLVTGRPAISLALGLVLGAIASATAPAATVNVLWEYKTRGPLTTAVFAIVAMNIVSQRGHRIFRPMLEAGIRSLAPQASCLTIFFT